MSPLTLFGILAVMAMLVFYALEDRGPRFVLMFAGACAASSIYGFVQGAWPFGVVEAVWTGVALQRWANRSTTEIPESRPIACDMSALTHDERQRYDALRSTITASVQEVGATGSTIRLRLHGSVTASDIAEWITLENRCCPFLNITFICRSDGTRWVELGGTRRIKEFLEDEFASILKTS